VAGPGRPAPSATRRTPTARGCRPSSCWRRAGSGGADTGKLTFTRYVDEIWFPNHVLEPSTREGYRYSIDKHLKPTFGPMRMVDILPSHVREWVTERAAAGTTPATIRHNKIVLSAIFTTRSTTR
jgi:hypothetical protein